MSAPLVVNTTDKTVWTRRAVTRNGDPLYALAEVEDCPDTVMATLAELAEHGIAGTADVLPVPVGMATPLQVLTAEQVEALVAAGNKVVNDRVHLDLCGCAAWPEKCASTDLYFPGAWDVDGLEDALPAVLAMWEQVRSGGEAELLRARIAELEAVPTTVFRASHDSIGMGLYTTAAEARKHCETEVRREHAETSTVKLWWREDEDTVDQPEDGEQELWETVKSAVVPGPGLTRPTGYVVTPLEVSSEYDAEADE